VLLKSLEYGKKLGKIIKKEFLKLTSEKPLKIREVKEPQANSSTVLGVKQQRQMVINANTIKINSEESKTQNNFDSISFKPPEQRVILDFEVFCFKWERYLLVERQYIKINETLDLISKCFGDKVYNDKIILAQFMHDTSSRLNFKLNIT